MEVAGVALGVSVSSISPLGSAPGEVTLWHNLTPVSTISIEVTGAIAQGTDGIAGANDVVTYEVTVTNTGTSCLSEPTLTDTLDTIVACQPVYTDICPQDAAMICLGSYVVEQADMDRSYLENIFTMSASRSGSSDGLDVGDSASNIVPLPGTPVVAIAVTGEWMDGEENNAVPNAGETLMRTYNITNEGTTSLTNVCITDGKFGDDCLSCTVSNDGDLPPGGLGVCTIPSSITQVEIDAGAAEIAAAVSATDSHAEDVSAETSTTVLLDRESELTLVHGIEYAGDPDEPYFGDTITFTCDVYNSGSTTLSELELSHSKVALACIPALGGLLLDPGAAVSCAGVAEYVVTQDDIDNGFVSSEVIAEGRTPAPDSTITGATDDDTTILPRFSSISIEKKLRSITTAGGIDLARIDAGDTAVFDISITNTGNTRLGQLLLTDDMFGDTITCDQDVLDTAGDLLPLSHPDGESISCEASMNLTFADIDAGFITGTAEVTSVSPSGGTIFGEAPFTSELEQLTSISYVESGTWEDADGSLWADDGEPVSFIGVVKNDGTVTMGALVLVDARAGTTCGEPEHGFLEQGETVECRGTTEVTQSEVNAGQITKEARISGTAANGVEVGHTVETVVDLPRASKIAIKLTATWQDGAVGGMAGYADSTENVTFDIAVTNTGNVDLTEASVISSDVALECDDLENLAVGEIFMCTGTRTIFWPDIASGWSNNTATVEARDPMSAVKSASDYTSTSLKKPPSIDIGVVSLFQDDAVPTDGKAEAGESIKYDIVITNDGYGTLYSATVGNALLVSGGTSTIQCPADILVEYRGESLVLIAPLVAGESVVCTGVYTLTAGDVNDLMRESLVTVEAEDQYGYEVVSSADDTVVLEQVGSVRVEVSHFYAKEAGAEAAATTDNVTFQYSLVNNGLLSLYNISVQHGVLQDHGTIITCKDTDGSTVVGSAPGVVYGLAPYPAEGLAPAAELLCSATDSVSQDEINSGSKESVSGVEAWHESSPGIVDARVVHNSSSTITMVQVPGIFVTKTANHTPSDEVDKFAALGESVEFEVIAKNTGNVELTGTSAEDPMFEGSFDTHCATGVPDPWEVDTEFTCTLAHAITQEDIDTGTVINTVSVMGTPPSAAAFVQTATASVTLETLDNIDIDIQQTLLDSDDTFGQSAGDTIKVAMNITNAGTTTLTTVVVSSSLLDDQLASGYPEASLVCDPALDTAQLAPGETIECTAVAEVQQSDLDAGGVSNDVAVAAAGPREETETAQTSWKALDRLASVTIVTSAQINKGENDILEAGDLITYIFEVENSGNTCLQELAVSDQLIGLAVLCDKGDTELCPQAAVVTCAGDYIITQYDIDSGLRDNTGTVSCVDSEGKSIEEEDSSTVRMVGTTHVSIGVNSTWVDGSEANDLANVGETTSHACTVKNEGTTSLVTFCITSDSFGDGCQNCPEAETLLPGGSWTCTIDTKVEQPDIDAGQLSTVVEVFSSTSQEAAAVASDTAVVTLTRSTAIALEITGSYSGDVDAADLGDVITYEYVISNVGTTTMSSLTLRDSAVPVVCSPSLTNYELDPATEVQCESSLGYSITQEDIDVGFVYNTATLEGWSPLPGAVQLTTQDAEAVMLPRQMSISMERALVHISNAEGLDADFIDAGDSALFAVTINNTGNTMLSTVMLSDGAGSVRVLECDQDFTATDSMFFPSSHPSGTPLVCNVTVPVTASIVDAGGFNGTLEVTAVAPGNETVRDDETTWTAVEQHVSMNIEAYGAWVDENGDNRSDAGEFVSLSVVVANKGTVALESVSVSDTINPAGCTSSEPVLLAQGEQHECIPELQITQEDLNIGSIKYEVTAAGTAANGKRLEGSFIWAENLMQDASIRLEMSAIWKDSNDSGMADYADEDEHVAFSVKVTNTGNVDLSNIEVLQPGVIYDCPVVPIFGPDGSFTCTGAYTLAWSDIVTGVLEIAATARGSPPSGIPVSDITSAPITLKKPPSMAVGSAGLFMDNFVSGDGKAEAGEEIMFAITINNDGYAILSEIMISDPLAVSADGKSTIVCDEGFFESEGGVHVDDTLVVDGQILCNYTYVLTADDVNDLEVVTTVEVTAKDEHDYHVGASVTEAVSFSQASSEHNEQLCGGDANPRTTRDNISKIDDRQYSVPIVQRKDQSDVFRLISRTLTSLINAKKERTSRERFLLHRGRFTGVDQAFLEKLSNVAGWWVRRTGVHVEINAGVKTTSIQVQAWHESEAGALNADVFSNSSGILHLTTNPDCVVEITTEHTPADQTDGLAAVGESIVYGVESTNTGNVDVAWATIADTVGSEDMGCSDGIPDPWPVDGVFICTPIYSITQADIDAGVINNSVSLTGYPLSGGVLAKTAIASHALFSKSNVSISATTTFVDADGSRPRTITYICLCTGDCLKFVSSLLNSPTLIINPHWFSAPSRRENMGSRGLSDASVVCELLLVGLSLAPGRLISCSAIYTVQQADVNDGFVKSTLIAEGETSTGQVNDQTSLFTVLEPVSSIQIVSAAEVNPGGDGLLCAGDVIEYSLDVTNTGNTCLMNVSISDEGMSIECDVWYTAGSGDLEAMFCPQDGRFTCIGTHYIRQEDMDAGRYDTTSFVTSMSPNGSTIADSAGQSAGLLGVANVTIDIDVSYAPDEEDGLAAVGQSITYVFNVTNSGSVTLASIRLLSPTLIAVSCEGDESSGGGTALALREYLKCSGDYVITQSDIDSGSVVTEATVHAESPLGAVDAAKKASQDLLQETSVSIETSGTWYDGEEGDGIASPLDEVRYAYVVLNNGTVTLANLTVQDAAVGGMVCSQPTLSPGESFTCQSDTYFVDQDDIDSGEIANQANVSSLSPQGVPEDAATSSRTSLGRIFGIMIGEFPASTYMGDADRANVGDEVVYSYDIHNNGTTTMSDIHIEDDMVPTSDADLSCNASLTSISPGTSVTCQPSTAYLVQQADIDSGESTSKVNIEATPPARIATPLSSSAHSTVLLPQAAGISITKELSTKSTTFGFHQSIVDAGDTLVLSLSVANTGNTWLSTVTVVDPLLEGIACTPDLSASDARFAAGSTAVVCTASVAVDQDMVNAGFFESDSTVSAIPPPSTNAVEANSTWRTDLPQLPSLALDLEVPSETWTDRNGDGIADPGETIIYSVAITNAGSVSLYDLEVTSDTVEDERIECPAFPGAALLPNATITCFAEYELTQADIDTGAVVTVMKALTSTSMGEATNATASHEEISMTRVPGIALGMGAAWADGSGAGELSDGYADEGDTVTFSFTVVNTGNVRLTGMALVHEGMLLSCDHPSFLYPGDDPYVCSGQLSLGWESIEAGFMETSARITASDVNLRFGLGEFQADATNTVELLPPPSISIGITSSFVDSGGDDANFLADVGESITYEIALENNGHAVLSFVYAQAIISGGVSDFTCSPPLSNTTTSEEEDNGDLGKRLVAGVFGVGEWILCQGAYTLTSDDIDALEAVSTASAWALDKFGKEVTDLSTATITLDQVGSLATAATFTYTNSTSAAAVGHVVDFSFSVRNVGLLTLFDIHVHSVYLENRASTVSCVVDEASNSTLAGSSAGEASGMMPYPDGGLVPGKSIECTASVGLLQAEINARDLLVDVSTAAKYEGNSSTLSGTTSDSAETVVTLRQNPVLQVEKEFSAEGELGVGQPIEFRITVENKGNVDLVDTALTDAMFENDEGGYNLACGDGLPSSLQVGTSFTCSPEFVIAQSEIDAGSMHSTARATAFTTLGALVSGSGNTTVIFHRTASTSFDMVGTYMDSDPKAGASAGDTITYVFDIENNGTTTLWGLEIAADMGGEIVCAPSLESLELAPGDKIACTTIHEASPNNLDAGLVHNSGVVNATSPVGSTVATAHEQTSIERNSSLAIVKRGFLETGTDRVVNAGDVIIYSIDVTNTGQTCLAIRSILDANVGDVQCPFVVDMAGEALFCPTNSVFTCTKNVTLAQRDLDMGSLSGNVTITAITPEGDGIEASAAAVIPLDGASSMALDLVVVLTPEDPEGYPGPGDIIIYAVNITNKGALTLHDLTSDSVQSLVWACSLTDGASLAPGAETKCVGQHVIVQENIDTGQVVLVVTVRADDSADGTVVADISHTLELSKRSALSVGVSVNGGTWVDGDGDGDCDPGEGIEYVIFVQNVGTVTLGDIDLTDDLLRDSVDCGVALEGGYLAPNASMACIGTYQIDQDDIDGGSVRNTALVNASDPDGTPVAGLDVHLLPLPRRPAIHMTETCEFTGSNTDRAEVGQGVSYFFAIKNTGSTTLADIDVTSHFTDQVLDGLACDLPLSDLARGDTVICSSVVDHPITQADIDAGEISDTSSVVSFSPAPSPAEVAAEASCTVALPRQPAMEILKAVTDITAASGADPLVTDAGDTFDYRITVSSTGNTWLSDVALSDTMLGEDTYALSCTTSYTGNSSRFSPGESFECMATLTLEQVHIDGRCVQNEANVSALASNSALVSKGVAISTCVDGVALLSLGELCSAGRFNASTFGACSRCSDACACLSQTRLLVVNVGTVTLGSIALTDGSVTSEGISCESGMPDTLIPGEGFECHATYTLVQDDVDRGFVVSDAAVSAVSPENVETSATAAASTDLVRSPQLSLATAGSWVNIGNESVTFADAGDRAIYEYTVRNIGNVRLANATVYDASSTLFCDDLPDILEPGQSAVCSGSALLYWDAIEGGRVNSSSTAFSTDVSTGLPVQAAATTSIDLPAPPSIQLDVVGTFNDDKEDGVEGLADINETISYTFTITNDGYASLERIVLANSDASAGLSSTTTCGDTATTTSESGSSALSGTLAVRASIICTSSYAVSEDDVNSLAVSSSASVTAADANGNRVDAVATTVVSLDQVGSVRLRLTPSYTKAGTPLQAAATNDSVAYELVVTNTGLLEVFNISVVAWGDGSGLEGALTCMDVDGEQNTAGGNSSGSPLSLTYESLRVEGLASYPDSGLKGGSSMTCAFSSAVGQTEINTGVKSAGGQVTAWFEGEPGALSEETRDETMAEIVLVQDPSVDITKSFVYVPSREDGLALIDEAIAYTITASNGGNVDLSEVALVDERFLNSGGTFDMECEGGLPSELPAGSTFHCYPMTAITQADIDAGFVASNVTITASSPSGAPVAGVASAYTSLLRSSGLTLVVSTTLDDGDGEVGTSPSDLIMYEMGITNIGTVTLVDISVEDALLSVADDSYPDAAIACAPSLLGLRLAPGENASCSASYPVSQGDVNAGEVTSETTVYADSTIGPISVSNSSGSVSLEQVHGIDIVVSAVVENGADGVTSAGDEVLLTYTITNTGNTCLGNVAVEDLTDGTVECDAEFSGDDYFCPLEGHTFTCTAATSITQENMDDGQLYHDVGVTAEEHSGDGVLEERYQLYTPLDGDSAFQIENVAEYVPAGGNGSHAVIGDEIVYTLTIENNGTVTLSTVTPANSKVDELSCEPKELSEASLDAGDVAVCTASYAVTQEDIDAGKVVSIATVSATDPNGDSIFRQTRVTQDLTQNPAFSIVLSSVHTLISTDGKTRRGDTIAYKAEVSNSGNTCLTDVEVTELFLNEDLDCGTVSSSFCPADERIICTGNYTLTQASVDIGYISNTATATAYPPSAAAGNITDYESGIMSVEDGNHVSWLLYPAISVVASTSLVGGASLPYAGDTLGLTFTVQNEGTTSLTGLSLEIPILERTGAAVDCTPVLADTLALAPEGVILCSASLELTQDNLDEGWITSAAFARGEANDGQVVLGEDTVDQEIVQAAGLSVVLVGEFTDEDGNGLGDMGETTRYTSTFENTGNVRVGGVIVSHQLDLGLALVCDPGFEAAITTNGLEELLPGVKFACEEIYSLTQADVDAATVVNAASIVGVPRVVDSTEIEQEESWEEIFVQEAMITLAVVGTFNDIGTVVGEADTGDSMQYSADVTNAGSVTLTSIVVTGSVREGEAMSCPGVSLAPAESMICNASYGITSGDIDSYQVENTVQVTATGPFAHNVSALGIFIQRLDSNPSVSLIMGGAHVDAQFDGVFSESDGDNVADKGESVRFEMVVRNTGMLSIHEVVVGDSLDGAEVFCPERSLEMAGSMACNVTYPLTQARLQ
ncbi:unnamed protein product [Scytosiphon promiscuus]